MGKTQNIISNYDHGNQFFFQNITQYSFHHIPTGMCFLHSCVKQQQYQYLVVKTRSSAVTKTSHDTPYYLEKSSS